MGLYHSGYRNWCILYLLACGQLLCTVVCPHWTLAVCKKHRKTGTICYSSKTLNPPHHSSRN